ncbi:alpha-xenorhabdolysin family binary toxin subunit B [Pseudomonas sp. PSKL.D1]|uniref:alpha-xenorhabdolysin family binary toxin subunit B n=1 Tax=Pseudomonas sp. PSKL.D1 TaxID=3029060 RepID=UPI002380EBDC|nr:alpha-xenorhabdolysin family binary toxin subunit B [Pseudomonas sp. PSKL.D1]WDY59051.1 alpha-xenorhabdolysin family binary toxin subunit B [Pseudomonas sp. PSKL.D1]
MVDGKHVLPELEVMYQVETEMRAIYYGGTANMLPAVREQLLDLVSYIVVANNTLREKTVLALVMLDNELDSPGSSVHEDDLVALRYAVQTEVSQVVAAMEKVAGYRAPSIQTLKNQQEELVATRRESMARVQEQVIKKEQDLKGLDEILKTLDRPSVHKALSNAIPKESDIDVALATFKDPTVSPELVKAALHNLNKNMEVLAQGREFADVLKARRTLCKARDESAKTQRELELKLGQAEEALTQFDNANEFLEKRKPWVVQAEKFAGSWQAHEQALSKTKECESLQIALTNARDYLLALRRHFEKGASSAISP